MDLFKREPQQQEVQEPPEHSVALRIVVFLMAALCVGSSCYFSRVEPLIWVLFMVTVLTGSYLSYLYRNDENKWLRRVAFIGIVAVGYLAGKRFLSPLSTEYDFVSPFVIFLAGVFSSLCFEMRSRSDLNLSSGLGLLLLCVTAPVARGLLFGGVVLSYILLGGLMLYFDCLSRTLNAWLEKTIEDAPKLDFSKSGGGRRRNRFGSTLGLLAFFPLLAAMMFLFMPRIDSLLDMAMAYAKTLNPDYVLDMAMGSQGPASRPPQDKGQSARDWFQKNSQVLSNLKKNEKKDAKTKEKLTSTQPDKDKAGIPEPKKDKDKKQQAKQEKQDKSKAKSEKDKKEKSKSDKDKEELNPEPQDKKKVDNPKGASKKNTPDSKKKQEQERKSKSKSASKSD
ncbi:MAG: transglutaminaseTgpA domain-containing protein, partial [Cyanobacteriota/Melainabacteria group bacterium]